MERRGYFTNEAKQLGVSLLAHLQLLSLELEVAAGGLENVGRRGVLWEDRLLGPRLAPSPLVEEDEGDRCRDHASGLHQVFA